MNELAMTVQTAVGKLFEADRTGRIVRVTVQTSDEPARTVEGRTVAYRLARESHSVVVRATLESEEHELQLGDIVAVEMV